MESLKTINFDHNQESVSLAVGLPEGEGRRIHERILELGGEMPTISETLEELLREFSGSHLLYALFGYGRLVGRLEGF